MVSHAEFLRKVTLDDTLVEALRTDWRQAPITDSERVMIEYVVQITEDATRVTPEHHERLRAVGFDDRGILQITLIASWFNYINRVAESLGVGRYRQNADLELRSRGKGLITGSEHCLLAPRVTTAEVFQAETRRELRARG